MVMKNLGRTVLIFTLATSISAFAASKHPGVSKASNVKNATAEATPTAAVQETDQRNPCNLCPPSEESQEQSALQKLIQEQEKDWLKDLMYNR
jgi:hypothetical protein